MKAKTAGFYGTKILPWTRRVRQESAAFLLRHSVIFANLYEHQQSKKGVFFAIRAKLTRFTLNEVEPRLKRVKVRLAGFATAVRARLIRLKASLTGLNAAGRVRTAQIKGQARGWLTRRKRAIRIAAMVVAILVAGLALAFVWQRSPALKAIVRAMGVAALGVLIPLWALLRGLGVNLGEGLQGLGRRLAGLSAGVLYLLGRLSPRFSRPVIEIVITSPGGDVVPAPSVDGHRAL